MLLPASVLGPTLRLLLLSQRPRTDGYLHLDFVKFRFNKCTPTCWLPHRTAKFDYRMVTPSSSTCMYDYRSGVRLVPLRTNVNDCRRKNGTGESEDPKYHDTDDMNIYGTFTTTSVSEEPGNGTVKFVYRLHVQLPSPRSQEPLPSTLEHARMTTSTTNVPRTTTSSTLHRTGIVPFAHFEGITPRRRP